MRLKSLVFLLFIILAAACKKDEPVLKGENKTATSKALNFHPLSPGTWWAYEYSSISKSGVKTTHRIDTVQIVGDTLINGIIYAKQIGKILGNPQLTFLRDSSGYLMSPGGAIYFSPTNFIDTFYFYQNGNHLEYRKMAHQDSVISVPAGSFRSSAFKYFHNETNNDTTISWHCYNFYSRGIGPVQRHHSYISGNKIMDELVDFHIAE